MSTPAPSTTDVEIQEISLNPSTAGTDSDFSLTQPSVQPLAEPLAQYLTSSMPDSNHLAPSRGRSDLASSDVSQSDLVQSDLVQSDLVDSDLVQSDLVDLISDDHHNLDLILPNLRDLSITSGEKINSEIN